ncbi:MAG: hypothetical protein OXN80_03425 [bacterium]|nr:hypothetical protein [bacterium]
MTIRVLDLPEWAIWAFLAIVAGSLIARTLLAIEDIRLKKAERALRSLEFAERWEAALRRQFGSSP